VLTIGSFDGVHSGHHRIISSLLNRARETSGDAVALTFTAHPRKIITPDTPPKILTTTDEKIGALESLGVENIILLDFTREMASMEAHEFLSEIVLKKMGVVHIVVGYDHAFGKDRRGTFEFLLELSHQRGFGVTRVEPKNLYSRPISSTWIRAELEDGNIAMAAALLGRNYTLSGTVVKGAGRGRTIGFPTANVAPFDRDKVLPKNGVYAVGVRISRGEGKSGMLNIGTNPTFGGMERTVEVNIFDFEGDIYGAEVEIEFRRRLRDEMRYDSVEALVAQIERDRIDAKEE
jgi:riboflavin kinase/FMN adenylyltransferase